MTPPRFPFTLTYRAKRYNKQSSSKSKIIIGCLYSGEPQLSSNIISTMSSFLSSDYHTIEFYIIGWNKNFTAHSKLYEYFNQNQGFDRIKLDADMSCSPNTITSLSRFTNKIRYVFQVKDYITSSYIYGVHYFPSGIYLDTSKISGTFPDRLICPSQVYPRSIGVDHCLSPSTTQIICFIIHRLHKSIQSKSIFVKLQYLKKVFQTFFAHKWFLIKNISLFLFSLFKFLKDNNSYKVLSLDKPCGILEIITIFDSFCQSNKLIQELNISFFE